jgi:hypothetical protein
MKKFSKRLKKVFFVTHNLSKCAQKVSFFMNNLSKCAQKGPIFQLFCSKDGENSSQVGRTARVSDANRLLQRNQVQLFTRCDQYRISFCCGLS